MRRTVHITIPGKRSDRYGERDNGKTFVITEMSSDAGERWCSQAKVLIAEAMRQQIPSAEGGEAQAVAALGIDFANVYVERALMDASLDSLWDCVRYQHDAKHDTQAIIRGDNSQIEEIATRQLLRMEVLQLQLGFSKGAEPPSSGSLPTFDGLVSPVNMPRVIATIISAGKATLRELQEFYSLRDAYDLVELLAVDASNQSKIMKALKRG